MFLADACVCPVPFRRERSDCAAQEALDPPVAGLSGQHGRAAAAAVICRRPLPLHAPRERRGAAGCAAPSPDLKCTCPRPARLDVQVRLTDTGAFPSAGRATDQQALCSFDFEIQAIVIWTIAAQLITR